MLMAGASNALAAKTHTYHFGVWRIQMRYDAFTGTTSCTMKSGNLNYANHVITFEFGGATVTDAAIFRVNNGPVQSAGAFQDEVKSTELFYNPGPLENPGDGKVRLPEKLFTEAAFVDIRPTEQGRVKHFRLDGFPAALAFMQQRGCPANSQD